MLEGTLEEGVLEAKENGRVAVGVRGGKEEALLRRGVGRGSPLCAVRRRGVAKGSSSLLTRLVIDAVDEDRESE